MTAAKTKKPTAKHVSKTESDEAVLTLTSPEIIAQTHKDMLFSFLALSVLFNLFVLITLLVLRVTTQYDAEVSSFLFIR